MVAQNVFSVVEKAVILDQHPHFPPFPFSCADTELLYDPDPNSVIGKAIDLNTLQGSSLEGEMHSLSGIIYSVAEIRYCAGRTILTIENMPRETARYMSTSPL